MRTKYQSKIPGAAELAFIGMMLMVVLSEILFIFGLGLSALLFWFGMLSAAVLAAMRSKKDLLFVLLIYAVGVLLSAAESSYSVCDAARAYFPMQRIIADGWNYVWELDQDSICAYAGTKSVGSSYIMYCPHLTGQVAAIVSKAFGLFCADPFCGIVMMSALCSLSFRFAMSLWHSRLAGIALAAGVAATSKMTSFLSGYVDYTIYSMMLSAALSSGLWLQNRDKTDLVIALLALAGAMASKATGISFAILFSLLLICPRKEKASWTIFGLGFVLAIVLCLSPYIVNVINSGSPFPIASLTSDFTGNEDAMRMGWLLRLVYAWVSPNLAIWIGKCLHGDGFNPIFNLPVQGYGPLFRILLLVSAVLLFISKKNVASLISVLLFISANLLPTKYIGFDRYCPQLWCLPMIVVLNFLYSRTIDLNARTPILKIVRTCACLGILFVAGFAMIRTIAYYERSIAWHHARIHEIKAMKEVSGTWRINDDAASKKCTAVKLCEWNGLKIVDDPEAPVASLNGEYVVVSASPISADRIKAFESRFRILGSVGSIFHFDWLGAIRAPTL